MISRSLALGLIVTALGQNMSQAQEMISPEPPRTLEEAVAAPTETLAEPDTVFRWENIWGVGGLSAIPVGLRMAPNGYDFEPVFALDLDLSIGLIPSRRLYLFTESKFWAQKAGPGITNADQGDFDFSKREFDLNVGLAVNYYGSFEARFFAFSMNNLNRGTTLQFPNGYKDGTALENRWYFGASNPYANQYFDIPRANFLSVGYCPTKEMIGGDGESYKPAFFARAYVTQNLFTPKVYGYADTRFMASRDEFAKMLNFDAGLAARPFERCTGLEFRTGAESINDMHIRTSRSLYYLSVRVVF